MGLAKRVGMSLLEGKAGRPLKDRLLYKLGELLVTVRSRTSRACRALRVAHPAARRSGRSLRFYRSIGVNLKQLYGMTETCVSVSMHASRRGEARNRRPARAARRGAHRARAEVLVRLPRRP